MASIFLSKLAKEYLSRDPDHTSRRQLYRLAWSRSSVAPHPNRLEQEKRDMDTLSALLKEPKEDAPLAPPRLAPPAERPKASFRPPRIFSKGALENDPKKNPAPIPYLLTETSEVSTARPVPGNSTLIRSLCRGKGVLRKNSRGLVYLDIDNRFISSLIPYLKAFGLVRPPYFNLFGSPEGAHIPVIPSRETAFQYLNEIAEAGQEFSFEIEGLYSIEPSTWPELEQVWFFKVKAPDLEKIRRRYFLPALPGGHSFHIAVAVKPRPTLSETPYFPFMRINVGYLAA